jgi:hypothetical protein
MYEAVILLVSLASFEIEFDELCFKFGAAYGDVYAIGVAVVLVAVLLMHFLQMKSSLSSISNTFSDRLRNRRKRCDLNVANGQTYLFFSNRNFCVSVKGKAQHLCHLR